MMVAIQETFDRLQSDPVFREKLAALLCTPPAEVPQRRLTYQEFLDTIDEDTLAEWEHGEVRMSSPASYRHQEIAKFLTSVMGIYVETHHLGIVCPAPFQMKLTDVGREPDLLFLSAEHTSRLQATYLDGLADLVVEIISLESVGRDRGTKFVEYETAGIPEYWLIDPLRRQMECYQLDDAGQYQLSFAGREQIYRSRILTGFWLRVDWLWQVPLPPVLAVIRELGLI